MVYIYSNANPENWNNCKFFHRHGVQPGNPNTFFAFILQSDDQEVPHSSLLHVYWPATARDLPQQCRLRKGWTSSQSYHAMPHTTCNPTIATIGLLTANSWNLADSSWRTMTRSSSSAAACGARSCRCTQVSVNLPEQNTVLCAWAVENEGRTDSQFENV